MQPLHERFLEAVAAEQHRITSRRRLLAGSARLAGGGALALAAVGAPAALGQLSALAQAQDFGSDLDILNYALTLEHLEYAFYRDGLQTFGPSDFTAAGFAASIYDNFGLIRDHEGAHVDVLTKTITSLGGTPVGEAQYDFGYGSDVTAFAGTAQALENTGVSAYDGAGAAIQNKDLLAAAGTIVAVEARHASYLNFIVGDVPFPDAFETPKSKAEILAIASPFIVSG